MKNATFHRNQTCCQHTMMTSKPAALRFLSADVRLQSNPSIKEMNVQFYCGYPVLASDGTMLGTLCCFDQKPHAELTQSQYSNMRELARTASLILEREAKRRLRAPEY
jgi:GAF domain-containing protein